MSTAFERPLYHGTIDAIARLDVSRGRPRKDFGQGFYMALDLGQAVGMMHKKFREAVRRSRGKSASGLTRRLYRIVLDASAEQTLAVKAFPSADMEWLEFVLANRRATACRAHDYDVVIGPTADDDTVASLLNYWNGVYGRVGSDVAKGALLSALEVDNLGVQCCLCTQRAVDVAVASFEEIEWRDCP